MDDLELYPQQELKEDKTTVTETTVVDLLNEQINFEQHSHLVYMTIGAWCDNNKYKYIAQYFYKKALEELSHAQLIINYLADLKNNIEISSVEGFNHECDSLHNCFVTARDHEIKVKDKLKIIYDKACDKNDSLTTVFIHDMLKEQIEEISTLNDYIDELELIGNNQPMLWHFNIEFK